MGNGYSNIEQSSVNERRRCQRYKLDIPIHVVGKDLQGNPIEEDTFTIDISLTGLYFLSFCDFHTESELVIIVQLKYPIGNQIPAGTWETKGRIVRVDHVVKDNSGKLKSQKIAVNFNRVIGSSPADDNWNSPTD